MQRKQIKNFPGSLERPISNTQPAIVLMLTAYFLRLCHTGDLFLSLRTTGLFLPFLTCTSFSHYMDFEKVAFCLVLIKKAVFMRDFFPNLWKSCQISHLSRLHFRSHSDLHTTLQTGSPFQLSEFGIGIGQQPKIAQDVCDTSRKQTDIMRNEMNTCWQSTYIHGC